MIGIIITAGYGPAECEIAVASISHIFCTQAKEQGMNIEVLDHSPSKHGLSSILIGVNNATTNFVQEWLGTVRWVCASPIRQGWPRKNWFVQIHQVEVGSTDPVKIDEKDLHWEAMKSSGPGGQHVNKTESAIRLTHRSTGVSVTSSQERSQHRNRALALKKLYLVLESKHLFSHTQTAQQQWSKRIKVELGNQKKTFRGPRFIMD